MNIEDMPKVDYANQRVVTTRQLAEAYNVTPKQIQKNFANARQYFKEGVHYFKLEGAALRQLKHEIRWAKTLRGAGEETVVIAPSVTCLYLWTYQGAARHCKMINSDEAWKVFDELERFYFEQHRQLSAPAPVDITTENEILKKELDMLKNQLPAVIVKFEFAVVYMLLMSNGSVKIGLTQNLSERMRQIKAESGLDILSYATTRFMSREDAENLERALLDKYADKNIGGEFFNIRFVDAIVNLK